MNAEIYNKLDPEQKLFADLLNEILIEAKKVNAGLALIVNMEAEYEKTPKR